MKSDNNWKERLGVVYSTNPDFNYDTVSEGSDIETLAPDKQKLVVAIDRRNRGGKQVTVVKGFIGKDEDLTELARTLKTKCGTGGAAKEGEIIIQGDFRDKVVALLSDMGYKAKRGN
ncbi:MAG: translation initiation factor [Bacteroidales bacterium]|nr:translation initiation factor [Bacteroidales bacterium]